MSSPEYATIGSQLMPTSTSNAPSRRSRKISTRVITHGRGVNIALQIVHSDSETPAVLAYDFAPSIG
jgi:hypothetical protein